MIKSKKIKKINKEEIRRHSSIYDIVTNCLVLLTFVFILQIFFVLRKKNNQVTTLHLYHHNIMVLGSWFISKRGTGMYFEVAIKAATSDHYPGTLKFQFTKQVANEYRSQWTRGLRRWSTAARLLRSWFRISPGICI